MEPTGIGVYIRGITQARHGTPKQAAKKARDHGVSFVVIGIAWQDIKKGTGAPYIMYSNGRSGEKIREYATAFKTAGIDVLLWGFPRGGGEEEFVARFRRVTDVCDGTVSGWEFDPEVRYKWATQARPSNDRTMRGQTEYAKGVTISGRMLDRLDQAGKLCDVALDAMDESLTIGTTSYGIALGHPNFPWQIFGGFGWGSPQLYSVGPVDVTNGVESWRACGWEHIVPSVPLFGKNSGAKLDTHLHRFDECNVSGFIFWSWCQGDKSEWRTIAQWAERLKSQRSK